MAKPSKLKSRFGGPLRTKNIVGAEVKRGDQDSSMVRKAMASQGIDDMGAVEGSAPMPRFDKRARGGRTNC